MSIFWKACAFISFSIISTCSYAAKWQDTGSTSGATFDKVYIDLESITQEGNFRTASFLTVYDKARVNPKGIKLDRHIQKDGFDCSQKRFSPISTIGYLEDRQVGTSPINSDWQNTLKDIPQDNFSQKSLAMVCNAPLATAPKPNAPNTALPPNNGSVNPPVVSKSTSGTGIAINSEGYVLTNNHVVTGCNKITVQGVNSPEGPAIIDVIDPKNDLALLKTSLNFKQVASFRSQARPAKLGEEIGVVGYPLVGFLSTEPKATFGQVNSVAGVKNDYTLLQISAPVQPGNSGGPVLDSAGSVIGVVVSQASMALAALVGNIPQNVNFAIRGEIAQIFMTAHNVKYNSGVRSGKLETEEIAEIGRQSSVFVLCGR